MGASTVVSRKSPLSPSPSPAPRNMDEYMRAIDRALAARYLQELRARAKRGVATNPKPNPKHDEHHLLMPRVDLCECTSSNGCPSRITATFELPGLKKTDLTLEVRDGSLIVEGERRQPSHLRTYTPKPRAAPAASPQPEKRSPSPPSLAKLLNEEVSAPVPHDDVKMADDSLKFGEHPHVHPISEIRYGRFRRTIKLPRGIEAQDIDATMEDGMLTVSWPSFSPISDIATRVSVK